MRSMIAAAWLTLAAALPAQFPIGTATPVGGYAPALFAEPLWLGNPDYGYRIQGAPPGGAATVFVSAGRVDQTIGGLAVYLDLDAVVITHTETVDAAGRATITLPLGPGDEAALAGIQAYAQAAVTDPLTPSAFGTTEGVLLEVTHHPLLAFTAWLGTIWLIDPVWGTSTSVPGLPVTTGITSMVFGNGGRDLFVATHHGVFVVDTLAPAPQAILLLPGYWSGAAWDRVHRRAYVLDAWHGTLVAIDGDRTAPSFGSALAQASAPFGSFALSADGTMMALGAPLTSPTRRDADPASPTYLQIIPTPPLPNPFLPGLSVGPIHLSPDGRVISLPVGQTSPPGGTSLHRFDGLIGSWIDHDPSVPGYQGFSHATHANVPPTFALHSARDGSSQALVAPLAAVARVDLDLHHPSTVVVTTPPLAPASLQDTYCGLTPSGQFMLKRHIELTVPTPVVLSLVQMSTGWETPLITFTQVPQPGSSSIVAWR